MCPRLGDICAGHGHVCPRPSHICNGTEPRLPRAERPRSSAAGRTPARPRARTPCRTFARPSTVSSGGDRASTSRGCHSETSEKQMYSLNLRAPTPVRSWPSRGSSRRMWERTVHRRHVPTSGCTLGARQLRAAQTKRLMPISHRMGQAHRRRHALIGNRGAESPASTSRSSSGSSAPARVTTSMGRD